MFSIPKKVIVRSNNFEQPIWTGDFLGRDKSCHNVPIVRDDKDGSDYLVLGIMVPYSFHLWVMLKGVSNEDQWNLLAEIKRFWTEHEKMDTC